MTAVHEVRFSPQALAGLEEAAAYIEEQSGAARSASWLRSALDSIGKLRVVPRAFASVCVRRGRTIHSKLVVSHRVFYFVDEPAKLVYIVDVVHTARESRLAAYRDD